MDIRSLMSNRLQHSRSFHWKHELEFRLREDAMETSAHGISGLVVKYIVAIHVTRVRFPAHAFCYCALHLGYTSSLHLRLRQARWHCRFFFNEPQTKIVPMDKHTDKYWWETCMLSRMVENSYGHASFWKEIEFMRVLLSYSYSDDNKKLFNEM